MAGLVGRGQFSEGAGDRRGVLDGQIGHVREHLLRGGKGSGWRELNGSLTSDAASSL